jgi:hypothetical protein
MLQTKNELQIVYRKAESMAICTNKVKPPVHEAVKSSYQQRENPQQLIFNHTDGFLW